MTTTTDELTLRRPTAADGADLWRLTKATGVLDVNSPYAYLLVGEHFDATSIVALDGDRLGGFISGWRIPDRPDHLFVWQVAVDESMRGRGVAGRMLMGLVERLRPDLTHIETTVTPSNEPSRALFHSVARRLDAPVKERVLFAADRFPGDDHEDEVLFEIGPFGAGSGKGAK